MLLAWYIDHANNMQLKTSSSRSKMQYDVCHLAYDREKN